MVTLKLHHGCGLLGSIWARPEYSKYIGLTYASPQQKTTIKFMIDLKTRWTQLEATLLERFGKIPDLNAILLLIGIQELKNHQKELTKEEKQDAMHVAVCTLLMQSGYYEREGYDDDGWPHFNQLKPLPDYTMMDQENFLKDHVLFYFEQTELG
jgi:hypothetical protein